MLDQAHAPSGLAAGIAALPCEVLLPEVWQERFLRRGPSATSADERRSFPRFLCLGDNNRAGMKYVPTFPGLERDAEWRGVYLCDVSRRGLRMLHSEVVYPRERLRVIVAGGNDLTDLIVEVMHCRRRQACCFEVGVRFIG
jgi:hypothetical protein